MNKLTLSINQTIIDRAKEYAKSSGKSLSKIVEEYLKSLSNTEKPENSKSPRRLVMELKGSVKMPKEFISYKELLQDALIEKYLKK
ncbi:MAG TPA: hypothetical protein ENK91_09335 [Bacteroidetes bacterium]|nr:hypothetical protein [Bacteroidota bacterium]